MRALKAMEALGLDLVTGISPFIPVEEVERLTGKRITGNGSTIRRDNKPWSYFVMEINKLRNSVHGFTFHGYKTRRELIGELDNQNNSSEKRMKLEALKIEERTQEKVILNAAGNLSATIYSKTDVVLYL